MAMTKWRHELGHHLFSAAVITAAMYWLSEWGFTGALDSQTLLAVSRHSSLSGPTTPEPPDCRERKPPLVLTISKSLYEAEFENTSPLDREKLTKLLVPSTAALPDVLVLDLDLSPAMKGEPSQAAKDLDARLDALAKSTRIVLVTPSFEGTPELTAAQTNWMADRCRGTEDGSKQLYFGLPVLPNESGVILRHPKLYPSIGNVARWVTQYEFAAGGRTLPTSGHGVPNPDQLCTFFRANGRLRDLRQYFWDVGKKSRSDPIDFRWRGDNVKELVALGLPPEVGKRVVFLGGSYDDRDRHPTGIGPQDGVVIHAAVFASSTHPASHALAALIEIGLGVALGFIFAALWRIRMRAIAKYHTQLYLERALPSLVQWLIASGWLAAMFVVGFAATIGLLLSSSEFMGIGYWLNPVPMVIGMSLDGYFVSRQSPATEPIGHDAGPRQKWPAWFAGKVTPVLGLIIVIITAAHLLIDVLEELFADH